MKKVWLKNYQPGVPTEINPNAYGSLVEIFEQCCHQYATLDAYVNMGHRMSYAELEHEARNFAAFLQQDLKLKKGDRIGLMMPNLLQYPIAMFGALRAGLIVVNINPLYTARELEYQLNDSEIQTLLVVANFAHTVQKVLSTTSLKNIIVTQIGDCFSFPKSMIVNWVVKHIKKMVPPWEIPGAISFNHALKEGQKKFFQRVNVTGDDIAYLQYTGGTTGIAKGAMLTHRNMVANLEQAAAWVKPELQPGKEIVITALPLYHIFSLTANCLLFFKIGALNVLITNPRDIPAFIRELKRYKFTAITGVSTLFNALLNNPEFSKLDFSSLRIALGGGMPILHSVAERWQKVTHSVLLEAYGLTEACPAVCINPLNLPSYNGTVGLPVSSTDISIRDENENELPFNTPGELWVKGPQITKGYWKRDEETKEAIHDGWLRTGDIATIDENGFVRIVDRKKDMILVSGFNVYPNEIEDVIASLPGVKEVAVVGVMRKTGETVKAFVVRRDPNLTIEKIKEFCRDQLTTYKIPKEIEFRDELPKTYVGKILRRELKEP